MSQPQQRSAPQGPLSPPNPRRAADPAAAAAAATTPIVQQTPQQTQQQQQQRPATQQPWLAANRTPPPQQPQPQQQPIPAVRTPPAGSEQAMMLMRQQQQLLTAAQLQAQQQRIFLQQQLQLQQQQQQQTQQRPPGGAAVGQFWNKPEYQQQILARAALIQQQQQQQAAIARAMAAQRMQQQQQQPQQQQQQQPYTQMPHTRAVVQAPQVTVQVRREASAAEYAQQAHAGVGRRASSRARGDSDDDYEDPGVVRRGYSLRQRAKPMRYAESEPSSDEDEEEEEEERSGIVVTVAPERVASSMARRRSSSVAAVSPTQQEAAPVAAAADSGATAADEADDEVAAEPGEKVEKIITHRFAAKSTTPAPCAVKKEAPEQTDAVAPEKPPKAEPASPPTGDAASSAATVTATAAPFPAQSAPPSTLRQAKSEMPPPAEVEAADEEGTRAQAPEEQPPSEPSPDVVAPAPVKPKLERAATAPGGESTSPEPAGEARMCEYFVKWAKRSYIHCSWITEAQFLASERHAATQKMRRYWKNLGALSSADAFTLGLLGVTNSPDELEDLVSPEFLLVDRIIAASDIPEEEEEEEDEEGDSKKATCAEGEASSKPKMRKIYLVKWRGLPYTEATWEFAEDFKDDKKIEEYKKFHLLPATPPPPPLPQRLWVRLDTTPDYKNGNALRPYQLEGLNWLILCWCQGRGSILADEMGLGKTVQVVSFFEHLRAVQLLPGPFIVVVPLSTLPHWERELQEWTDMNVVVLQGGRQNREEIKRWEWFYLDDVGLPKNKQIKFTVLLTTYEMVMQEISDLSKIKWQVIVVDEAQRLKNHEAKLIQHLHQLIGYHRILLTGTPIQNNISELWSLLHYIDPNKFGDLRAFAAQFGDMKSEKQVAELQTLLRQYLLRRMKSDVEKSIPPKEETILDVELTSLQKQYYRAIYEHNREFLYKGRTTANLPNLMNMVMQLRKVCNHPFLIKGVEDHTITPEMLSDPEAYNQALIRASGKLVLIDKLLPKLKANGHKVLIFSQLKSVLDILERYLRYRGYLYERLDGGVKANDRQGAIDRFCAPGSDRFVFLLSTRAGGQGINLAVADTVVIYDSDWNPQNDVQAQARCHRIGQKKEVKVYRLISRNTYERFMFERASKKLGLDQAVLHNMSLAGRPLPPSGAPTPAPAESPAPGSEEQARGKAQLGKDDVEMMLKFGAYHLREDDGDRASANFCEEDIDQILERRSSRVVWQGDAQGSLFSTATFALAGEDAVDVNAPDFWEKVMPASSTANMLLEQFSKVVTGRNESETRQWVDKKKFNFLSNLQKLVEEVVRSYNEAKGVQAVERDTLRNVLMLCSGRSNLFTVPELQDINHWLDEIDFSRHKRKQRTPQPLSYGAVPATSTAAAAASAQRESALDEDEEPAAADNDSSDAEAAFETPAVIGQKKRRSGLMPTMPAQKRKRGRPNKRQREDSDFEEGGDDGGDSGVEGLKQQQLRNKKKRGGVNVGPGGWTSSEKRALQDALFAIGRPNWEQIRDRAKLSARPLSEIAEACAQLVKLLSSRCLEPTDHDAFERLLASIDGNRPADLPATESSEAAAGRRRGKRRTTVGGSSGTATMPVVFSGSSAEQLDKLDKRLKGWSKRLMILERVQAEVERARQDGRRPLEGVTSLNKPPAPWWVPSKHDSDLLSGIEKHGWGAWDAIITDESLGFFETLKSKISRFQRGGGAAAGEEEAAATTSGVGLAAGSTLHVAVGWPANKTIELYVKSLLRAAEKVHKAAVAAIARANSASRGKRGRPLGSGRRRSVAIAAASALTAPEEPAEEEEEEEDEDELEVDFEEDLGDEEDDGMDEDEEDEDEEEEDDDDDDDDDAE